MSSSRSNINAFAVARSCNLPRAACRGCGWVGLSDRPDDRPFANISRETAASSCGQNSPLVPCPRVAPFQPPGKTVQLLSGAPRSAVAVHGGTNGTKTPLSI